MMLLSCCIKLLTNGYINRKCPSVFFDRRANYFLHNKKIITNLNKVETFFVFIRKHLKNVQRGILYVIDHSPITNHFDYFAHI